MFEPLRNNLLQQKQEISSVYYITNFGGVSNYWDFEISAQKEDFNGRKKSNNCCFKYFIL